MRIAVACNGLEVSPQFTQSSSYMCYNVDLGIVTSNANTPIVERLGEGVVNLIKSLNIDLLITGHIESGVAHLIQESGVEVVPDASGSAANALHDYLESAFCCDDDDWDDEDNDWPGEETA